VDQPASGLALLMVPPGPGGPAADLDLWRRARRRRPNDFWVNHDLAVALERGGPGQLEEAVGFYRTTVALRPDSPGAWYNLGNALTKLKRPGEAVDAYTKALDLNPDSTEAEAEVRLALAAQPDYAPARCNLGVLLLNSGKTAAAEAELRQAIAAAPEPGTLATAHNALGALLERQTNYPEAEAAFRTAL